MSPPAVGARRRTRRSRRARFSTSRGAFNQHYVFNIRPGNFVQVKVSDLTNRPPLSNFKPINMKLQVVSQSSSSPYPPAVQALFLSPLGLYCATSELVLLGSTTRVVHLRYPRTEDWYSYNVSSDKPVIRIDAACTYAVMTNIVGCILTVSFAVQTDVAPTTCPVVLYQLQDDGPEDRASCTDGSPMSSLVELK